MSNTIVKRYGRPPQLLRISIQKLASLYFSKKLSLAVVADQTGLSFYQVRAALLRAGYKLRTRGESLIIRHKSDRTKWLALACQVAGSRGGACLSTDYVASRDLLTWQCSKGHKWRASLNNIKDNKTWCQKCAGRMPLTIEAMNMIAKERGGKCLSVFYKNNQTKLLWECSKGHKWAAMPANIKKGQWCPTCAGKDPLTIENMQRNAMERGGRCLSTKYVNSQTKLRWECSKGHRWWAVPNSVRSGSWCKVCAGLDKPELKELHAVAKARGGKCLSDKYKSARTQMYWECAHGHQWKAVWDKIRQGKWCPECATGIGERICRAYFEQLFGVEFPKVRPKWLRSSTGTQLELDGYNKRLSLAFEHHGRQHYERVSYFGQDEMKLSHRKRLDEKKRALCAERGIDLIGIPGIPDMLPLENIQYHIRYELERLGRKLPPRWGTMKVNLKSAYASPEAEGHLDQLKQIAQSKGGKCLSVDYVNDTTKLLWQCKKGHEWKAIPGSIKQGTWCPTCAQNIPKTIEDAYLAARAHKGKCLSRDYVNSAENLRWECSNGHQWNAPLARILGKAWCPLCVGRGKTIGDLRKAAATRGGVCVSAEYLGVKAKHLWQCDKGHQWQATAESVIRGSWCPVCSGRSQTIDDMKAVARDRAGKCLSVTYRSSTSKLRWQCSKGHEWEAVPSSIKAGRWCPVCRSTKLTLQMMHEIAAKRGGHCLSNEYVNAYTKLLWRCKSGHEWPAAPKHIISGSWCPICVGRRPIA